jgi:Carboxypeptidase regulatory-like domain
MAAAELVVRGTLRDASGGGGVAGAEIHVSSGDDPVSSVRTAADGSFEVTVPASSSYLVTALAPGLEAWRRRVDNTPGQVDLGQIEMSASEYPPGVAGQVWDRDADAPVVGGRVDLRRDEYVVGVDQVGADGAFAIELTASRLLPPGSYELVVEAPGYSQGRRTVEVRDDMTSYQVGRVELEPVTPR